jgi:vancomycin resistance protein YoaR
MLSRSCARRLEAVALLFCLLSATSANAIAQGVPAQPAAPSSQPQQSGTAAPSTAGTNPAPQAPASAPVSKPEQQAPQPTQLLTADTLLTRMSLGDGVRMWHPSRRQLGMSLPSQTGSGVDTQFDFDPAIAKAYLLRIAPYIEREPVLAHIALAPQYSRNSPLETTSSSLAIPAVVIPAEPGVKLDVDGSVAAIQQALADSPTALHIVLAMKSIPVPNRAARYDGINARIAHFVTHFNPYERGRTQTVRRAIDIVDGNFVAPGQIFSLNDTVGERTSVRGFGSGIVFVDGHLDTQLGGGMCQVATTLFNAVLLANLKVVERHQHVRTVPYVRPGQDATVYWGEKDFKFQNNTDVPVYISYRTTATHAICDLYGKANPEVKVAVGDEYVRLGPRHYTAVLRRYVTANGHTTVDFEAHSDYQWTPKLDYTF